MCTTTSSSLNIPAINHLHKKPSPSSSPPSSPPSFPSSPLSSTQKRRRTESHRCSSPLQMKISSPRRNIPRAVQLVVAKRRTYTECQSQIHDVFAAARQRAIEKFAPVKLFGGSFPGKGAEAGCVHYRRNAWIKANCCDRYYPCRRCHDDDEDHEIDRHAIKKVGCVACGEAEQDVSNNCVRCGIQFAKYFCGVCNFFDNTEGKEAYHCNECGICRVGKGRGIDQHHCDGCNTCVPIEAKNSHPCREQCLDVNCPICKQYLATSTEACVLMKCGHTMHFECLVQYTKTAYTCPICNKSLTDMHDWIKAMDERIAQDIIPSEYANRVSRVLCNDCSAKTEVAFHPAYHKCGACGNYNTRILEQFDRVGGLGVVTYANVEDTSDLGEAKMKEATTTT